MGVEEGGREGGKQRLWRPRNKSRGGGGEDPTERGEGAVLGTPRAEACASPWGGPALPSEAQQEAVPTQAGTQAPELCHFLCGSLWFL